jgi:hypothetical protein
MPTSFVALNPALYKAIKDLYKETVHHFEASGEDLNSQKFLGAFPRSFIGTFSHSPEDERKAQTVLEAAFSAEFRTRTEEALTAYYSDHAGGTPKTYFCDLVDDFLNYAIPRTAGIANSEALFDQYYASFDRSLYSESFPLTVIAVLENASDHSGSVRHVSGVSFHWWSGPSVCPPVNTEYVRNRVVPYLELVKNAHPIGMGREIEDKNHFFVMQYTEERRKSHDAISQAYTRSEEITKKVVFAIRLLTSAAAYADYRGFRMPGHMSGYAFIVMNYPDELIDCSNGGDLGACAVFFERLIPALLDCPYNRIAVLDHKIEDAMRRARRVTFRDSQAKLKADIDMLLDFLQALEAIIPERGSYTIALHASVLLRACRPKASGLRVVETFEFLRDMYKIRNAVMHGDLGEVLEGRVKTKYKLEINQLRRYVHDLAILHILNDDLARMAHLLALGERVAPKTIYY